MALTKLIITPDQAGYSVTDGKEVIDVKLDGGASRFRRDILGATSMVSVRWSVGPEDFRYLRAFYRTVSAQGSEPFLIDLFLDETFLTEHKAYFIPGSMRLQSQRGLQFVVGARLEVVPDLPDSAYDEMIVTIYNEYGSNAAAAEMLEALETLVNVQLPEALG